ncbi:predicted protein [Sclerotinia sclerotiorum 1980 UF-70]|uniref:Uncharacterized protein n=2 Tax=Sclerotinia sclerotiorum (strain ATCC 18683 / 1980 / Ss-1) TaxID=665079 RepID=A7EW64_SCLS1|nr:predicted protein [Sclerotinia sclerotiorum 1980 UF-70]APA15619.1 hypothetical protein sscle_15g103890 [Sclerotinia sclerotiorum 1980 UF-70]EDN93706.1 predicted protein [Sclerotinia sclerotiorum 1980 UF-70]
MQGKFLASVAPNEFLSIGQMLGMNAQPANESLLMIKREKIGSGIPGFEKKKDKRVDINT